MGKLNIGAGGSLRAGADWINIDLNPWDASVLKVDADEGLPFPDSYFDEVVCHGCLAEFKNDVVFHMNQMWRVLENGGVLDIVVAVVDNGIGPHRDPLAHRYLSSEWVNYFAGDFAGRIEGGRGLGFKGKFDLLVNEVGGETHHVVLRAVK